jgi:hypothetical protein
MSGPITSPQQVDNDDTIRSDSKFCRRIGTVSCMLIPDSLSDVYSVSQNTSAFGIKFIDFL